MNFENEDNGLNINNKNETENQESMSQTGLYHDTSEQMQATGNHIYYQNDTQTDRNGFQRANHTEHSQFTQERQPASYGNYEKETNFQQGGAYSMRNQYEEQNTYYDNQYQYEQVNNDAEPPKKKRNKKSNGFGKRATKLVAGAAVFGLVAGVVFQGVNYGADRLFGNGSSEIQLNTTSIPNGSSVSSTGSVSAVAQSAMPAIVAITSTVESIQYGFFNQQYKTEGTGSGSGIIIAKDEDNLYVATNNHVIEDATKVQVTFYSGSPDSSEGEIVDATIVGTDPDSDLAVVKVPVKNISEKTLGIIKVASLGDSDEVTLGQQVVAIGNALGYGQSITSGYVSALNREVQLEDKTMTLTQTDAAINPGNSGGALINMNGEVIGINSAKYSESGVEGMGYAIPMATAKPILEDIMNESSVPENQQAYLGITGSTVSDQYRQYMGTDIPSGVYVATVTTDSPAEKGGLYANDIIVKFNDRDVSTMDGLQSLLSRKKAGETVTLTVKRQNQNGEYTEKELTIKLGKKTESIKNQQEQQNNQNSYNNGNYYNNGSSSPNNENEFWSFFN